MTNTVNSYKYASEAIKGYSISKVASKEKNDCFVRAIASATDTVYDTAHEYTKEVFGRKNGQGTMFTSLTMMKLEEEGMVIGDKKFKVKVLGKSNITNAYKLHGDVILRKKTVKSFIQSYPKGTYIVGVSKHAFTIKDGVLIDNQGEEFRPTRKVDSAFKITNKTAPRNIQLKLF